MKNLLSRRAFVTGSLSAAATVVIGKSLLRAAEDAPNTTAGGIQKVSIVQFSNAGQKEGIVVADKVVKSDAEWQKLLSPEQYEVTRRAGTEPPFQNKYAESHEKRPLSLHLLRDRAVQLGYQIRLGHRMAEFLGADRTGKHRDQDR